MGRNGGILMRLLYDRGKLLPVLLASYLKVQSSKRDRRSTDGLTYSICSSSCDAKLSIRKRFFAVGANVSHQALHSNYGHHAVYPF